LLGAIRFGSDPWNALALPRTVNDKVCAIAPRLVSGPVFEASEISRSRKYMADQIARYLPCENARYDLRNSIHGRFAHCIDHTRAANAPSRMQLWIEQIRDRRIARTDRDNQ